jgi:cyclic beta-1,2-glucan synthetase
LRDAIKHHAWDGRWYRRAYFDDGTPLGSVTNRECQIDSIAQSWAVIAEHALKEGQGKAGSAPLSSHSRLNQAMDEVLNRLCHPDQHLMLLFDPPFDSGPLDPGYIKGYLPGIRENGGQYTHAACWVVQALALLGRADDAFRIYDMINPIQMTKTSSDLIRYTAEPYVIAADVYHHPQHIGRAGWSWYTGSAAWYYRVGLENVLGFILRHDRLYLNPAIPSQWPGFTIRFRYGTKTSYVVEVHRRSGNKAKLMIDGAAQIEDFVKLVDDGQTHQVTFAIS